VLLQLRKWCDMTMDLLSNCDHGQVNLLKSLQQGFCRGTAGGAFGIAHIQALPGFVSVSQTLADAELEQDQDAQANRQQANKGGRKLVTPHIHRREQQRFALESSKSPLHQMFLTIAQHRLFRRQPFLRVIGRINPPGQATASFGHGSVIHICLCASSRLVRPAPKLDDSHRPTLGVLLPVLHPQLAGWPV